MQLLKWSFCALPFYFLFAGNAMFSEASASAEDSLVFVSFLTLTSLEPGIRYGPALMCSWGHARDSPNAMGCGLPWGLGG